MLRVEGVAKGKGHKDSSGVRNTRCAMTFSDDCLGKRQTEREVLHKR